MQLSSYPHTDEIPNDAIIQPESIVSEQLPFSDSLDHEAINDLYSGLSPKSKQENLRQKNHALYAIHASLKYLRENTAFMEKYGAYCDETEIIALGLKESSLRAELGNSQEVGYFQLKHDTTGQSAVTLADKEIREMGLSSELFTNFLQSNAGLYGGVLNDQDMLFGHKAVSLGLTKRPVPSEKRRRRTMVGIVNMMRMKAQFSHKLTKESYDPDAEVRSGKTTMALMINQQGLTSQQKNMLFYFGYNRGFTTLEMVVADAFDKKNAGWKDRSGSFSNYLRNGKKVSFDDILKELEYKAGIQGTSGKISQFKMESVQYPTEGLYEGREDKNVVIQGAGEFSRWQLGVSLNYMHRVPDIQKLISNKQGIGPSLNDLMSEVR